MRFVNIVFICFFTGFVATLIAGSVLTSNASKINCQDTNISNENCNTTKVAALLEGYALLAIGTIEVSMSMCCFFLCWCSTSRYDSRVILPERVEIEVVVVSRNNEKQDECCICLEPLTNIIAISKCNHAFHRGCLDDWLAHKRVCPLCIRDL